MIDDGILTTRRRVLGAAVLGGAWAASGAAQAGRTDPADLDLGDPKAALDAYIKLRGSTAAETTHVQYDGDIIAVRSDGDSVPLVGFRGIAKSHWRPDGQGGYVNRDFDVGVIVDHRTGARLTSWRNPFTGETVKVIPYISGPTGGTLRPGETADDPYGNGRGRWGRVGDHIWQTNSSVLSWPNPLSPKLHPRAWSGPKVLSSMSTTYSGRISDVVDPAIRKAPATLVWNDILSPSPWMRMGTRSVMCDWRMIGAKAMTIADLDASLVAEVEAVFPGYVTQDAVWTKNSGGWTQYRDQYPDGEY